MTPTAIGRKTGSVAESAAKTRNSPLFVTWERKAGPPPSPGPPREPSPVSIRTAIPMRTGTAASTPSRARVRQRRNMTVSSERRSPRVHSARPGVRGAASAVRSACDIESLSGECDEGVLQRGPFDAEGAYADAAAHQGGVEVREFHLARRSVGAHPVPLGHEARRPVRREDSRPRLRSRGWSR